MSDQADPTDAALRESVPATAASPAPARRRAARWPWALLVVGLVSAAGWYLWNRSPAADDNFAATPDETAAPAAAAVDVATLQRSLDDAARVNRALREQVLGLTQRVGLVEDGLAGMERGAAPGVDAVRLAEADFLLRLGEERLRLFGDVAGARASFELADAQLAEVSDPRATSVRQTLALERDALAAIAVADLPVILGRLDGLAEGVSHWPLRGRDGAPATGDAPPAGWWRRAAGSIDRYFRVRRVDPDEHAAGGPLLRERMALDLSRARLLLLRGEGELALRAIKAVRASLQAEFDPADDGVSAALTVLDEIRSAPLAPALPSLGEARRELARLRGAPEPAPPAPAQEPSTPVDAPAAALPPDPAPAEAPEGHLDVIPPVVPEAAGDAPAAPDGESADAADTAPQG
ncbi:MAG: uroporphyrinogen-III C-methyltransferase [Rhodanobacteraceae bacterium]|nr:uroporphyrinogen-III C-methyltransferase [Rhodanobacteraceae bacterium]